MSADRGNLLAVLRCSCQRAWRVYDGDGWADRQFEDHEHHGRQCPTHGRLCEDARQCDGERTVELIEQGRLFS